MIYKGISIREAFGIESVQTDYYISKYDLGTILKSIVKTDAKVEEIERAIEFINNYSNEKTQERKIKQVERGQEGFI